MSWILLRSIARTAFPSHSSKITLLARRGWTKASPSRGSWRGWGEIRLRLDFTTNITPALKGWTNLLKSSRQFCTTMTLIFRDDYRMNMVFTVIFQLRVSARSLKVTVHPKMSVVTHGHRFSRWRTDRFETFWVHYPFISKAIHPSCTSQIS